MSIEAKVIIGSSAGDEGKGLAVDYYAHQANLKGHKTLVVLNNGGPQHAHTVSLTDGTKHIFRHVGSGTFAGADTYLSAWFLVNPIFFAEEHKKLKAMGYNPVIYVDERCRITTPYEMILNQIVEQSRGKNRHGSCGMGIWETVKLYDRYVMRAWGDYIFLASKKGLIEERKDLFQRSFSQYLNANEITDEVWSEWQLLVQDEMLYQCYLDDLDYMYKNTIVCDSEIINHYDEVIFENGQGLLLNDDPNNVHTTPSNTGLDNIRILEQLHDFHAEPIYVTRTYLTRHGADPAFIENKSLRFSDETNIPNPFQGAIRYGNLDMGLIRRIEKDSYDRDYSILVTHTNEMILPEYIKDSIHSNVLYSCGKERESVGDKDVL